MELVVELGSYKIKKRVIQKRLKFNFAVVPPSEIKRFQLYIDLQFASLLFSRVSGVPILWGWDKCSIEGLVWKPKKEGQPETAVAVGVVIEAVRLDKLLEKLLGNNLFSSAWFSEMTASRFLSILSAVLNYTQFFL